MDELLEVETRLLAAWLLFRVNHNLKDAQLMCCDTTRELFDALQAFENMVWQLAEGGDGDSSDSEPN